ncbi:MAG: ABC transporter permease [Methanospirillum sp.]|uniref:ABC transporter permease n=1 Tax=Methanospirillum sp. TaxID=45200 RepID=UPI002373AE67|nr:ABC transporter permease [Methanospirillum sp.]MDD1730503.1 ABC transporter permease [Methanospirillum sp.]
MNLHRTWVITKKELSGLANEKTILLAILLQLFIALFSSFLMVGLSAMYDPATYGSVTGIRYGVGVVGNDTVLSHLLDENPSFKAYQMDLPKALGALKERKLAAVIWTPGTLPEDKDPVSLTLYTIKNDIQSAVIEVKLKEIFLKYENLLRDVRSDRITRHPVTLTASRPVSTNTFYEFIYALLIPLLLFMPAIISAGLVIDLITEEYQQQTLDTLRTTPASLHEIVWGKIASCVILIPVESGLWLVLLSLNGIRIGSLPEILLQVIFASSALILVAAVFALWYRDRTKAQFIFSTAAVILLLLILAFPGNPLNIIALLASGSPAPFHWPVLLIFISFCVILSVMIRGAVRRTEDG